MKGLMLLGLLAISFSSMAQDIFQLKKSKRIGNVLVFKANIANCKLKSPFVTAQWIMGEEGGRIEGLNKTEKSYFTPKITYGKESESSFMMGALEKMEGKVTLEEINVRLENCVPKAYVEIKNEEIQLTEIFATVNSFMMPQEFTVKGKRANGTQVAIKIK